MWHAGTRTRAIVATAAATALAGIGFGLAGSSANAKGPPNGCKDGSAPPCKPSGGEGEAATNNLSVPVVFPDGKPSGWVELTDQWTFWPVPSVGECITEVGVPVGEAVPDNVFCYYARQNTGINETTGVRDWVGEPGDEILWWLQERSQNKWQAYHPEVTGPLAVTAVDIGDLLESLGNIKQKQVRTEVSLLQRFTSAEAAAFGAELFEDATVSDFAWQQEVGPDTGVFAAQPVFAAFKMSGAVPGTDQSINEIQGTDYGPGGPGDYPGTGRLIDSRTVLTDSESGDGFDATVYSQCARLEIQKVTGVPGDLTWDDDANRWTGSGVNEPVVDISASDGTYTAEINAGGRLIYGYNWNTKTSGEGTGLYRLTFVLDAGCEEANAWFDTTYITNGQTTNTSQIREGNLTAGEDSLAYVDVYVTAGGGGGGGGKP